MENKELELELEGSTGGRGGGDTKITSTIRAC